MLSSSSSSSSSPLILLLALFIPLITADSSCAPDSLSRMNHCNVIIDDMRNASIRMKDDPVASRAVEVFEKCTKALKCVRTVDCNDARVKLDDLKLSLQNLCGSLNLISGPVGKCVEKLRAELPTLKSYTCARFLSEKRGILGVCPMYQFPKNYECAVKLMAEKCGKAAREELVTKKERILKEMNCL